MYKVFCPVCEQINVCKQEFKKTDYGDGKQGPIKEVTYVTCGFWSESAGRCAVGLLADGLKSINETVDRLVSVAEDVCAAMDVGDSED